MAISEEPLPWAKGHIAYLFVYIGPCNSAVLFRRLLIALVCPNDLLREGIQKKYEHCYQRTKGGDERRDV
jgi:hypothetical protein